MDNFRRNLARLFTKLTHFTLLILLTAACAAEAPTSVIARTPEPTSFPPTPTPSPTPTIYPWTDESAVMSGLCFESVYDAAGQVFILRSEEALTALFDLADHSELCRFPVRRGSFDFSGGRILAGTWTRGQGCDARHDVVAIRRDDVARIFALTLRFVTEGTCPYQLVRPFWIGLDGLGDYDVRIIVET